MKIRPFTVLKMKEPKPGTFLHMVGGTVGFEQWQASLARAVSDGMLTLEEAQKKLAFAEYLIEIES